MSEATEKAAEWWSDPQSEAPETQWVRVPGVVENMNRRATGDPAIDWINHSAGLLTNFRNHLERCRLAVALAVIERTLRRHDFCQLIHGVDVAEDAIESARKTAQAEGLNGITYEVADLNTAQSFPPRRTMSSTRTHRSIMFFSLNTSLTKLNKRSKPGGLFVVYSKSLAVANAVSAARSRSSPTFSLKLIPERYRRVPKAGRRLRSKLFGRRSDAMNSSDPSEGIRANRIVPLIASRFEIKHFRYVGGTLLLLVFNGSAEKFSLKTMLKLCLYGGCANYSGQFPNR